MTMLTNGAKPCLSCNTTGGFTKGHSPTPSRSLGLCNKCYMRARSLGLTQRYPACGAVPLDRQPEYDTWSPAPWGHVPFDAAPAPQPVRWTTPATFIRPAGATLNPTAHARTIEAEMFAANWLAERTHRAA